MNPELTKKLYDRFPELYRQKDLPMSQTCMCWGFDVDDGWFDIVWMLSLALEDESKQTGAKIEAMQVKEKFAGLRFYPGACTERAYTLISLAERMSYQTCEVCGKHGRVCSRGTWLKTVCKEHAAELKYDWKEKEYIE
jgi:hypothetical protein